MVEYRPHWTGKSSRGECACRSHLKTLAWVATKLPTGRLRPLFLADVLRIRWEGLLCQSVLANYSRPSPHTERHAGGWTFVTTAWTDPAHIREAQILDPVVNFTNLSLLRSDFNSLFFAFLK